MSSSSSAIPTATSASSSTSTVLATIATTTAPIPMTELKFNPKMNDGKVFNLRRSRSGTPSDKPFLMHILGCQDNRIDRQISIEIERKRVIEETKQDPEYLVLLGDMGPPDGFKSRADFEKHYYGPSVNRKKPAFVAMGNHEHGFPHFTHKIPPLRVVGVDNDLKKAEIVIRHTYENAEGEIDPAKVRQFSEDTLYLDELEGIIAPARYYALNREDEKVRELFIDSNTYQAEAEAYAINPESPNAAQVKWLQEQLAECKKLGVRVEIRQHNPIRPNGKRAVIGYNDADENLSAAQIATAQKRLGIESTSYNYSDMLYREYMTSNILHSGLHFACAHEHATGHVRIPVGTGFAVQSTIGNGGGDSEDRMRYNPDTLMYSAQPGFAVRVGQTTDYRTIADPVLQRPGHWIRIHDTLGPQHLLREDGTAKLGVIFQETFRQFFIQTPPAPTLLTLPCRDFKVNDEAITWTAISKITSHEPKDASIANDIYNYFLRYEPTTLAATLIYLNTAFAQAPKLFSQFKIQFRANCEMEWEAFTKLPPPEQIRILKTISVSPHTSTASPSYPVVSETKSAAASPSAAPTTSWMDSLWVFFGNSQPTTAPPVPRETKEAPPPIDTSTSSVMSPRSQARMFSSPKKGGGDTSETATLSGSMVIVAPTPRPITVGAS